MARGATSLESGQALYHVLVATHPLCHAAVHSLPTHGKGVEQMLKNGLALVKALQDQPRTFKLEALLNEFQSKRQEMEFQKNHLENQLDQEVADIQAQRAALDRKEKEAKERMIRLDLENTETVSALFSLSIGNLWVETSAAEPQREASDEEGPKSIQTDAETPPILQQ